MPKFEQKVVDHISNS